jgi:hypothetical protein
MEVLQEEKGGLLTRVAQSLSPNIEAVLDGKGHDLKFIFEESDTVRPTNKVTDSQLLLD